MFWHKAVHEIYRKVFKICTVCIHYLGSCHSSFQVTIKMPAFLASINQILSHTGYHYPLNEPDYCHTQATIIPSINQITVTHRLPLSSQWTRLLSHTDYHYSLNKPDYCHTQTTIIPSINQIMSHTGYHYPHYVEIAQVLCFLNTYNTKFQNCDQISTKQVQQCVTIAMSFCSQPLSNPHH
jgi:hypothetical protein